MGSRRWWLALYWLIPVAVVCSVWVPVIAHYHVRTSDVSDDTLAELRTFPGDDLLAEIGAAKHSLIPPLGRVLDDPVAEADRFLSDGPVAQVPFNPELLGSLDYAMLVVPRTLLKAYEVSGDERYFEAAHRFIFDWAEFERRRWIPTGLLWNDHAIAARAITFSEFWRLYRSHSSYEVSEARAFLRLVAASAARLKDPQHYTHASNHGTMQSIALMHLALAFPQLEGFPALADLGMQRLLEQTEYMVSPEGVVLEHSAGYHRLGMELMGVALRYQTLLEKSLPAELVERYGRAREVYSMLLGPDGRLPPVGDTSVTLTGSEPLLTDVSPSGETTPLTRTQAPRLSPDSMIYPIAGYAVFWPESKGLLQAVQSTVAWSWFPRHGHKHADELSINIRDARTNWWTSVGYWPLGHPSRRDAESWGGSNAPHLVGETYDSVRETELVRSLAAAQVGVVDMLRRGPDEFSVRRQIVFVEPSVWLILDSFTDRPGRTARVIWGTGNDNRIETGPSGQSISVVPEEGARLMQAHFLSSETLSPVLVRGMTDPFAGWVEDEYRAAETDAIMIELPSEEAWLANVSVVLDDRPAAPGVVKPAWEDAEHWEFRIELDDEVVEIARNGDEIDVSVDKDDWFASWGLRTSLYQSWLSARDWRSRSRALFDAAEERYESDYADLLPYRTRVSLALAALMFLQFVTIAVARRMLPGKVLALRFLSVIGWLAAAGYVHLSYLTI